MGDEVEGPFIGPEGLKKAKESIRWIPKDDDMNRLVAEIHPLTGLKHDPEVVGGQNQGLGLDSGFNKKWGNRNDINELMSFAQTYLDDRGKNYRKFRDEFNFELPELYEKYLYFTL